MHLEVLAEDASGAIAVNLLIQKFLERHNHPFTYRLHSYKGIGRLPQDLKLNQNSRKRLLLDKLPKLLKGYFETPGIDAVLVVLDSDRHSCTEFLQEIKSSCPQSPGPILVIRLAIEEIEAWYMGDSTAIKAGYPKARMSIHSRYRQDSICSTWEILADILYPGGAKKLKGEGWPRPGQVKCDWAAAITPHMEPDRNSSPSFRKFWSSLESFASGRGG